jgi:uncharacterized protein (TIGR00369 family)
MANVRERVAAVFSRAPFIRELGIELLDVGEGWVESQLVLEERHLQQHGFAHAGVVSTIADHTAGAAASTVISEGQSVLTAEYSIHLLRPGSGNRLRSRGEVVKSGRTLIVAASDVWADEVHCARYVSTLTVVERAIE